MSEPTPPSAALADLQQALRTAFAGRPRQLGWGEPEAMRLALSRVRQHFGKRQAMAREQRIARAVLALRVLGQEIDFVRLKYVCWGLAQAMDWESRRVLDDAAELRLVLGRVAALQHDARRFAACCRGLAASRRQAESPDFPLTPARSAALVQLDRFLESARPRLEAARRKASDSRSTVGK